MYIYGKQQQEYVRSLVDRMMGMIDIGCCVMELDVSHECDGMNAICGVTSHKDRWYPCESGTALIHGDETHEGSDRFTG